MSRAAVILTAAFALAQGCSQGDTVAGPTDPVVVGFEAVPAPGEGVYFNLSVRPSDDPRELLEGVIASGINLIGAWQPRHATPCMAPTATEALVVQLEGPAAGLADFGFVSDPKPWVPNCGIQEFLEYRLAG